MTPTTNYALIRSAPPVTADGLRHLGLADCVSRPVTRNRPGGSLTAEFSNCELTHKSPRCGCWAPHIAVARLPRGPTAPSPSPLQLANETEALGLRRGPDRSEAHADALASISTAGRSALSIIRSDSSTHDHRGGHLVHPNGGIQLAPTTVVDRDHVRGANDGFPRGVAAPMEAANPAACAMPTSTA